MSGAPGTTIRVTGRLATGDSCDRMVVTLSEGASGVGDVQRVPVVGGTFHAAVDQATSAPPGTRYVRAFCDYASDGATARFEVVARDLPNTGAPLAPWVVLALLLLLAGGD